MSLCTERRFSVCLIRLLFMIGYTLCSWLIFWLYFGIKRGCSGEQVGT